MRCNLKVGRMVGAQQLLRLPTETEDPSSKSGGGCVFPPGRVGFRPNPREGILNDTGQKSRVREAWSRGMLAPDFPEGPFLVSFQLSERVTSNSGYTGPTSL